MRRRIAVLLASLLAAPALAQDRPPLTPTRDVSVTYRTAGTGTGAGPGTGAAQEMRMSWLVAEQKLRVDMPGGMGWSVVDRRAQKMVMVMDQQRMVMELPMQGGPGGLTLPTEPPNSARFTRGGSATIAGIPCTVWQYEDGPSRGEACLTADGVMLRSSGTHGGQSGTVEAVAVAFGAQDPARFRVPAGYQPMQLPSAIVPGRPPAR